MTSLKMPRLGIPLPIAYALMVSLSGLKAAENGMNEFLQTKYGFFVHYVWGGKQGTQFSRDRYDRQPATFDEFAAGFDAKGLADDLSRWGVEYVILTAWHFNINPLFPSETMKKWGLEKHACKRDVLRDVITACKAKGIKVMLYTHPRDGHDLELEDQLKTGWGEPNGSDPKWENFDRRKWNDFTNELYGELIARYGNDIIGIYSDEGSSAGDSYRVVDYPRLRKTMKSLQPDLMMVQNFYGTTYSLDLGGKEYHHWGEFENRDGNAWPAYRMPVASCFATTWWSAKPAGKNTVVFSAEDMFRYTILQAGANHEGGGAQWAAGNYIGGGWETGVDETMTQLGSYIKPIAPSIKGTLASVSWPTRAGTKLPDLQWGVATRSPDDKIEYLHILKAPANGSRILSIPPPADGRKFAKAVLLETKQPVSLKQDDNGLQLALPEGAAWDRLDTVIALKVADDSPTTNLAMWKAFRASSFPDPSPAGGSAYAFSAVDGDPATAWTSRPDGLTEGNEPVPPDKQPWCQIDLGRPARLTHIELSGRLGMDLVVEVSPDPAFADAKPLSVPASASAMTLEIIKATYGVDGHEADVTSALRDRLKSGATAVRADNALAGGDPAPNSPKRLRVEQKTGDQTAVREALENDVLELINQPLARIQLPPDTLARFLRVRRTQPGEPLVVNELRAFGKFE